MNFLLFSGMIFVNGAHVYILAPKGVNIQCKSWANLLPCTYTGGFMLSIMIVMPKTPLPSYYESASKEYIKRLKMF